MKKGKPIFPARKWGRCPGGRPKGRKWFNVIVKVNGKRATVFIGRRRITTFTTYYQGGGHYGAMALNGFRNTAYVKNLRARPSNYVKLSYKLSLLAES